MSKELIKELLGDLYTDAIGQKLGDKELAVINDGSYIPRQKFNEKDQEVKEIKKQLQDRDQQLKDLEAKSTGNEELKKELQALQAKNKTATEEYDKKMKQMQFDFALERALTGAKAKNPKAVRALLDTDTIKLDGEKLLGLDEQIKNLQKSDAYLFGEATSVGNESNPGGSENNGGSEGTGMNAFIRAAAGR